MRTPGYSEEIVGRSIARQKDDDILHTYGGVIDLTVTCEPFCFDIGGWCFLDHCVPVRRVCVNICRFGRS